MAEQRYIAEQLLQAALAVEPDRRSAFLTRACGSDEELKQFVDHLLQERTFMVALPTAERNSNGPEDSAGSEPTNSFTSSGAPSLSQPFRFRPGDVIMDRFLVVRFIARGGMGEVYEVADRRLQGVHVALKTVLPKIADDPVAQTSFEREVLLAREVTHPNLCPIYDIFHCEQPPSSFSFLTMKLLRGESLSARLKRQTSIPKEEALAIARQMAAGMAAIHGAGIVHRDIKPGNIMLEGSGESVKVWITDFGLARAYETDTTHMSSHAIAGTVAYMAPELLRGQPPSAASDVFAFGLVLHQVFTGERPVIGSSGVSTAVSQKLQSETVPPKYARLITACLADDPQARSDAFQRAQPFLIPGAIQEPAAPETPFWTRRRFFVASAATACAVAGGAWWKWGAIEDALHPLPQKRFVALLFWPPAPDSHLKPTLAGVLDAIESRLSRIEAFDRNLFIISPLQGEDPATTAQVLEMRDSLGANLVLAASGLPRSDGFHLNLRVLGPSLDRPLREKQILSPPGDSLSLPERAVQAAAQLLNVSRFLTDSPGTRPGTTSPEAYAAFHTAEELRKQDNDTGLSAAIQKYQQAVDIDPHYAVAYAQLAIAYVHSHSLHHNPTAIELARQNAVTSLRLDPDLVEGHRALACVLEETGDEEGALREAAKALAIDPSNATTLVYQGQIYARIDRWAEAESSFRRAIKERPNYWLPHSELGVTLGSQGKYAAALEECRLASLASPRNALAFRNVGTFALQLGYVPEALENLKKSLDLSPNDAACRDMAFAFQARGRFAEALSFAQKATTLDPTAGVNWGTLGDTYSAMRGHVKEAKDAYARAAQVQEVELQADPTDGSGWMLLALFKAKVGETGGVLSLVQKAESYNAGDIDSQLVKAQILAVLGKRDEAIATLSACLKRGATQFQIQNTPDLEPFWRDPRLQAISQSNSSS